jgi:hypothetical protein
LIIRFSIKGCKKDLKERSKIKDKRKSVNKKTKEI